MAISIRWIGCILPVSYLGHDFQAQLIPFFLATTALAPLFHLKGPGCAQAFVCLSENEGSRETLLYAGRISAAMVALNRFAVVIHGDHSIGAGRHAFAATVTFFGVNLYDAAFVFGNGPCRTGVQTFRAGALETDIRDRVALQGEISDMNPGGRRVEATFFNRRADIDAPVTAGA